MDDRVTAAGVSIEAHAAAEARELAAVVCGLYEAVFSLPPFSGDEGGFAGQRSNYPGMTVLDMWFDDAHGTRPDPPSEGASR
jgi:hypothetical protein